MHRKHHQTFYQPQHFTFSIIDFKHVLNKYLESRRRNDKLYSKPQCSLSKDVLTFIISHYT